MIKPLAAAVNLIAAPLISLPVKTCQVDSMDCHIFKSASEECHLERKPVTSVDITRQTKAVLSSFLFTLLICMNRWDI